MKKDYYLLNANEHEEQSTNESLKMKFLDNLFDNTGDFRTSHSTLDKSMSKESRCNSHNPNKLPNQDGEDKVEDLTRMLVGLFIFSVVIFIYFFTFKWALIASILLAGMLLQIRNYYILYNISLLKIEDKHTSKPYEQVTIHENYDLMEI